MCPLMLQFSKIAIATGSINTVSMTFLQLGHLPIVIKTPTID